MSQVALFNGKHSTQEEIFFDPEAAEHYARTLQYTAAQKKRSGQDATEEYAKFLSMFHMPLIRRFKPGILTAPGVITIEQQGGTTNYGAVVTFRHTQAGDFSRHAQLNFGFTDVSCTGVEYRSIGQLLPGSNDTRYTNYHLSLLISITSSVPVAAPGANTVSSTLRHVLAHVLLSPCGPDGRLIKYGDTVRNFVVMPDYPGEVAVSSTTIGTGSNEYSKYDLNYHIMRRELLPEDRRLMYDEVVGQQRITPAISETCSTISGRPSTFGAINSIDFLGTPEANSLQSEYASNSGFSTYSKTLLDKYKLRSEATATLTTTEHRYFSDGLQTPKPAHRDIRFGLPVWIHSTVDSENAMSNMSFASFIRTYQFTIAPKSALFNMVPGDAAILYKSSIILQHLRSHVGFTETPTTALGGTVTSTTAADHVYLIHQNVLCENEVVIPALITGSTIEGGEISTMNITSSQIYLIHTLRPIIEQQSAIAIYHLPDMHTYHLPTTGNLFSINSNDNRWVSKFLLLLPYSDYNRSLSNPNYHQTWHKSGYAQINYIGDTRTMDIPSHQVQHLTSFMDSVPVAASADIPTPTPTYHASNVTQLLSVMGSPDNVSGYTADYIKDRYTYQSPIRKQHTGSWSKHYIERPIVTKVGLRVQSFAIYDVEPLNVVARAAFFYDNEGISPRDKQLLMLKLSLSAFNEGTNTGGLNLSKYRDVMIQGSLNTDTTALMNALTPSSASLALCSYAMNVLITTNRAQFRRFAN